MSAPEIAIAVASHARPLRLRWLLNALEQQTLERSRWELVVAHDSGPDSETERLLASHPAVDRHLTFTGTRGPGRVHAGRPARRGVHGAVPRGAGRPVQAARAARRGVRDRAPHAPARGSWSSVAARSTTSRASTHATSTTTRRSWPRTARPTSPRWPRAARRSGATFSGEDPQTLADAILDAALVPAATCRARAERFSIDRCVGAHEQLYRSVLN